jgi:hypothetical protein
MFRLSDLESVTTSKLFSNDLSDIRVAMNSVRFGDTVTANPEAVIRARMFVEGVLVGSHGHSVA